MAWLETALDSSPREAGRLLAGVFGDGLTAQDIGGHFTCSEAEEIARALVLLGQEEAAATLLLGHSYGDDEGDNESHQHIAAGPDWFESFRRAVDHLKKD